MGRNAPGCSVEVTGEVKVFVGTTRSLSAYLRYMSHKLSCEQLNRGDGNFAAVVSKMSPWVGELNDGSMDPR